MAPASAPRSSHCNARSFSFKVTKRRGPGDDAQVWNGREIVDDALGETIGQVFRIGVAALIGEGKDGDRIDGLIAAPPAHHIKAGARCRGDRHHEGGNRPSASGVLPSAFRVLARHAACSAVALEILQVDPQLARRLIAGP
jgi:hypothetical protein